MGIVPSETFDCTRMLKSERAFWLVLGYCARQKPDWPRHIGGQLLGKIGWEVVLYNLLDREIDVVDRVEVIDISNANDGLESFRARGAGILQLDDHILFASWESWLKVFGPRILRHLESMYQLGRAVFVVLCGLSILLGLLLLPPYAPLVIRLQVSIYCDWLNATAGFQPFSQA